MSQANLHSPRSLTIGDTAFFEAKQADWNNLHLFGKWLLGQGWFKPFAPKSMPGHLPDDESGDTMVSVVLMQRLEQVYVAARAQGAEPEWFGSLPIAIARRLEYSYLIGEAGEQYKIVPCVPYAGFGFVVFEGGIVEEVDEVFGLGRLNGIRQLGSLHDPTVRSNGWREFPLPFLHTRYIHSLDVCAIVTLIGKLCDLSERDFLTLRVAAQSHDALTPAGGDSIKYVDRKGLDEDIHYPELFFRPGWKEFRKRNGISEAVLVETILGKGLLGSILDVCDKLAYTGRDLDGFLRKNPFGGSAWEDFGDAYDRITSILNVNPYPCSVWDCVEVRQGELVFTNRDRLADFLRIRALMFRILYNNAAARFRESGFIGEVAKVLYDNKKITRDMLLEMVDTELFAIMSAALKTEGSYIMSGTWLQEDPRVVLFRTAKEAICFEREIASSEPRTMTHMDVSANPSTEFMRRAKVVVDNRIVSFEDACPFPAWDIKQILHDRKPYRVFMYNLDSLCRDREMANRLIQSRNKRIGIS